MKWSISAIRQVASENQVKNITWNYMYINISPQIFTLFIQKILIYVKMPINSKTLTLNLNSKP